MKANRTPIWQQDDRAQVGIGTMIVFIATILVAATAAAVLVDTSGKLQERSSTTGNEATKQVASNLIVKMVTGERRDTSSSIDYLNITVGLAPGAKAIDLQQLKIQISNGDAMTTWEYNAAESVGNHYFQLEFERDADSSADVMNSGDLVDIKLDLEIESFEFAARKDISITMIPESGGQVDASFSTPETYGSDLFHVLK